MYTQGRSAHREACFGIRDRDMHRKNGGYGCKAEIQRVGVINEVLGVNLANKR